MIIFLILTILFGYLIGSIPFGLILTKIFLKQDIRTIGSGNTGATNVLRTGHKRLALATLLLDALKGFLPIFYIKLQWNPGGDFHDDMIATTIIGVLMLMVVIGHCFPIWLKFRGGKGVATTLGVLLASVPVTGLVAILIWLLSFLASRISSLAAISAMIIAPVVTLAIYGMSPAILNLVISALVIARHHSNIRRLMKGEEPQFRNTK